MAAVAVSSAAMAQVTISGNFAVNVDNTLAGVTEAYVDDARVKFAVAEDLGGGVKLTADTMIETNGGRNTSTANQGWSVALSGAFGKLSARNYLRGSSSLSAGISASEEMEHVAGGYAARNRMQYDAPEIIKGLGIALKWDNTGTSDPTSANVIAQTAGAGKINLTDTRPEMKWDVSYATGPVAVTFSGVEGEFGDATVELDLGMAKISAWADKDGTNKEFTLVAPITSALSAGVHILRYDDAAEALGARATYAVSKRTAVSLNYMDITQNARAAANVGTNYRLKINHSF